MVEGHLRGGGAGGGGEGGGGGDLHPRHFLRGGGALALRARGGGLDGGMGDGGGGMGEGGGGGGMGSSRMLQSVTSRRLMEQSSPAGQGAIKVQGLGS